jgi:hypothetical protein
MDALLNLAEMSEQIYKGSSSIEEHRAAMALVSIIENPEPPKRYCPILRLKAKHHLKYNRENLAVFLAFNITLTEMKHKFENTRKEDHKLKVKHLQKRIKYLFCLDVEGSKPRKLRLPLKVSVKKPSLRIIPFPTKQFRTALQGSSDCVFGARYRLAAR